MAPGCHKKCFRQFHDHQKICPKWSILGVTAWVGFSTLKIGSFLPTWAHHGNSLLQIGLQIADSYLHNVFVVWSEFQRHCTAGFGIMDHKSSENWPFLGVKNGGSKMTVFTKLQILRNRHSFDSSHVSGGKLGCLVVETCTEWACSARNV